MSEKTVKIDIGDGAAIPSKKDRGLLNAWHLSLVSAVGLILYLTYSKPDPYWRILQFL